MKQDQQPPTPHGTPLTVYPQPSPEAWDRWEKADPSRRMPLCCFIMMHQEEVPNTPALPKKKLTLN